MAGGAADFRSDLMAGIPAAARAAMLRAAGEAPEMGLRDDPHQSRLERMVSELAGFEDALFVPTCTLANQIALRLWCRPGDIVLTAAGSHVAGPEAASTAGLAGVAVRQLEAARGHLRPETLRAALAGPARPGDQPARLVWLENTHMRAGGTIAPGDWVREIGGTCREAGLRLHIDGSRLWNAEAATGLTLAALAEAADSLSLSLNKALGAPAGSLLLGSRDFIREALAVRATLGASWRPVGFLAAGAIEAVAGRAGRLGDDHRRARLLHAGFSHALGPLAGEAPDTNIVLVATPPGTAAMEVAEALGKAGVLALPLDAATLRFVLHARIGDAAVARAVDAVRRAIA
ncbi:aminotransferase class I/II-fold pyridoxal phosphate-dependent enzyme [Roseomonas hellenica]|uniref:Aminotransferase class I/II-fold pyridoxal phosphate-dependent enzyme n=1 Tax=Plastoroseomonas hellenica TaxID=2687306 RepID=A0ABS5EYR3_9PROT|nr:aminotransferase class I/II-fold pyridoxal phosphate-dependent enzyme [Plastoroseomonas hellenica]